MSGRRTDLPLMPSCTGCGECCTTVSVRPEEAKRVRRYVRDNDVEWKVEVEVHHYDVGPNRWCGFLRKDGDRFVCAIYDVRPWACRAFGVVKQMPCSWFPEDAVVDASADQIVGRRWMDPSDRYLGEYFEPGYLQRMRPYLLAAGRRFMEEAPVWMARLGAPQWLRRVKGLADGK